MENSKKKSGGAEIPKRNRSLDLKSLYKSRVPEVGGSEKKVSKGNDQEDVKKKKRKSGKEGSLSCFEKDAKKRKKEDGNGMEKDFDQGSSGGSKGLHGISLSLSASAAFNFPRRPRGSVARRKRESDQLSKPVANLDSGDCTRAINETVKKSEDKGDRVVKFLSLSAGTEGISNSKSTGKVGGPNSKSKKEASKSKFIASSSSVKLKRKAEEEEVKESGNSRPHKVGHSEKQDVQTVNNGDKSSAKSLTNNRKEDEVKESGNSRSAGTVGNSEKQDVQTVTKRDKSSGKRLTNSKEDEVKESGNSKSGIAGHSEKQDVQTVIKRDKSSAKRLINSRKEAEVKEGGNSRSGTMGHCEKQDVRTVTKGEKSSAKHRINRRKEDDVKESGNKMYGAAGHSEKDDIGAVIRGDASSTKCLITCGKEDKMKKSGNRSGTVGHSEKDDVRAVNNKDTSSAKPRITGRKEDEVKKSGNSRPGPAGHSVKGNVRAVNDGDTCSVKRQITRRKEEEVKKNCSSRSDTVVHSEKEDVRAANNGETSSAKPRIASRKEDEVKKSSSSRSGTVEHSVKDDVRALNDGDMHSVKRQNSRSKEEEVKKSCSSRSGTLGHSEKDVKAANEGDTSSVKQHIISRKENGLKESNSSVRRSEKEYERAVNNGDPSFAERLNKSRKKDLVVSKDGGKASGKKTQPSVGTSVADSIFNNFINNEGDGDEDDDDEQNLEENAARMLSSRFDPSCTGFASKRKSSATEATHGFSFPVASKNFSIRQAKSSGGMRSSSADDASRSLRPRTEENGKGPFRKRRHFYEILPTDLDAYWVLNRRVKIFWPLDDCWYDGLLDDYNPEIKLHHIKYDDREEEWVNLEQEKFKLLLFPSEVPEKSKSKRQRSRKRILQEEKTVPPSDDDSSIGNDIDSQPIATWLARSSQRFKSLPRSFKRQRPMHMPVPSSLSSEKTDNSYSNLSDSIVAGNNLDSESAFADDSVPKEVLESLHGATGKSQSCRNLVYVRKKCSRRGESISLSGDVKTSTSVPGSIAFIAPGKVSSSGTKVDKTKYGLVGSENQLSINNGGGMGLNVCLATSDDFRFQVWLPVYLYLQFSCGACDFGLLHDILMLHYGLLVATSPAVNLEILFIDNNHGLRFLFFEGCLNQALAVVFLVLVAFSQPDEQKNCDIQLPVTSIRFKISGAVDVRKRHVFAFYCFSKQQSSKWHSLNSKLIQHCRLVKQLPVSECTYDNIKDLECRNSHLRRIYVDQFSSSEGCKRRIVPGILPMGGPTEANNRRMSQSAYDLAAKPGRVPHFALSFSAAPTFFLNLHLELLMEHTFAWAHLHDSLYSCGISENSSRFKPTSSDINQPKSEMVTTEVSASGGFSSPERDLVADGDIRINLVENADASTKFRRGSPNGAGDSCFLNKFNDVLEAQPDQLESTKGVHVSSTPALLASIPPSSSARCDSGSDGIVVEIPPVERVNRPFDDQGCISSQTSDVDWSINDGFAHSPFTTGPRSLSKYGSSSAISSLGDISPVYPDGKTNCLHIGLSNGPKKPRTQVRYTMPFAGNEFGTKQKAQNQRPCKRIRKASLKKISDGSRSNQKKLDSLACGVNVLVTHDDKGWRESGAHVVLEVADHNEWRLAVKLSGITKYSYKVKHILQPGSTNRFSHAMMWKGGKDWVLEFPDRSQWTLFKEMHEECYNRNIRAASVKNIPIPGVQLIEDNDDYGTEIPFVSNPTKYFRQVQNDVELALDPSRILYDLDSDDEQWLMANKKDVAKVEYQEISEELLEKTIDMLEKISYIQHRDSFTNAEIEELLSGLGSAEAAIIYDHWRQKRHKKGMPLIRHLQPPLWQRYQQQLKEWENDAPHGNGAFSVDSQEKVPPPEKPPMFAFCLKPRGLDVPNKGSKQRSHRKFSVSAHHHLVSGDSDGVGFGRRVGDEKVLYPGSWNDYSDLSPALHASTRVFSPRDAHFSLSADPYEWNRDPKFHKSKKQGSYSFLNSQQMISYNQRTIVNRNGVQQWNMGLPENPTERPYHFEGQHSQGLEQLAGPDLEEFRLRDASSAAKHARNVAKLKRERAQRLLYRADLAIHKAAVAIMTADALKTAHESSKGDN